MRTVSLITLCFAICTISAGANAQQRQAPAPGPALNLALEAAQTAINVCADNGYKVTVTVIDSAGAVKAQVRSDGVSARTLSISQRKANTSLKYGEPTMVISQKVKTDSALAAEIENDESLLSWGGARPLMANGKIIGAIGVSGAPGGDKDDVCTVAAIEKIQTRL